MYTADGRTLTVRESEVEAYKNVGWYTSPVKNQTVSASNQLSSNDMVDVYASVLLRRYRSMMKDPSSFKLNSVYAGYDSSIYSGYDFVAVADVSGRNSYGGITRNTYVMLLNINGGRYIVDLKGYADRQADSAWGSDKLKWMDVSIKALKTSANASAQYKKLDNNMITRLVLSE